jgi:repressor LexA
MSRPLSTRLSDAQRKLLSAVGRLEARGDPAFVMDIAKSLRLRGESSITRTLNRMERNGFVKLKGGGRGRSRVVCLTTRGRVEAGLGGVPLLGWIPAGPLKEAIAQTETFLDERELLACRPGDFALRVKGDSMIGDGILEDDKVLLRPDVTVENGEIAAVLVGTDNEATLKRIFFSTKNREVILRASNPRYPDMRVAADEVKIAGVFRGLFRERSRPRSI